MKKILFITSIVLLLTGCTNNNFEHYSDLALQSNNEGKYEDAIKASDRCIELKDDIDCWIHKANANYHLNECTKALTNIYHAVMLDANHEEANAMMVMLLRDPKCPELNKIIENNDTDIIDEFEGVDWENIANIPTTTETLPETEILMDNPVIDVNPDTKTDTTLVKIGKFYDGQDGFSLSIQSGNSSVCIWTWEAGSGRIPDLIITEANTALEKHTRTTYPEETDNKVTCVDDFGNIYVGDFPDNN
jgi:hypothetical protein